MTLSGLGLAPLDEQVWRFFLRTPGSTGECAAVNLDLESAAVDDAIVRLRALEILSLADEGGFLAAEPQRAFALLLGKRLEGVTEELHSIVNASAGLSALLIEQRSGRPFELIERLETREAAQQRIAEVGRSSREVLAMQGPDHIVADSPTYETDVARTLRRLKEGAEYRTLIHPRQIQQEHALRHNRMLDAAGDRRRISKSVRHDLILFDRSTAFVRPGPDNEGAGALMIRQPSIAGIMGAHFERLWETATDLDSGPLGLTETERQVLTLLSEYGKDEAAAREMGVSVRTFRRHVADLLARLGATNRFQAGRLAARRGWL